MLSVRRAASVAAPQNFVTLQNGLSHPGCDPLHDRNKVMQRLNYSQMFIDGTFKNEFAVHFVPLKRIATAVDIVNNAALCSSLRYATPIHLDMSAFSLRQRHQYAHPAPASSPNRLCLEERSC